MRGAAFRTVKSNVVAQQTIQPTLVAGFNQNYDDFNGTKADQGAVGADLKLRSDLTIGVEAIYRNLSAPEILNDGPTVTSWLQDASEGLAQAYLYWTPTDRIAVSFALQWRPLPGSTTMTPKVCPRTSIRSLHRCRFATSIRVASSRSRGRVCRPVRDFRRWPGQESDQWGDSWLVDAAIGYRLPNRRGIVEPGIQQYPRPEHSLAGR